MLDGYQVLLQVECVPVVQKGQKTDKGKAHNEEYDYFSFDCLDRFSPKKGGWLSAKTGLHQRLLGRHRCLNRRLELFYPFEGVVNLPPGIGLRLPNYQINWIPERCYDHQVYMVLSVY